MGLVRGGKQNKKIRDTCIRESVYEGAHRGRGRDLVRGPCGEEEHNGLVPNGQVEIDAGAQRSGQRDGDLDGLCSCGRHAMILNRQGGAARWFVTFWNTVRDGDKTYQVVARSRSGAEAWSCDEEVGKLQPGPGPVGGLGVG